MPRDAVHLSLSDVMREYIALFEEDRKPATRCTLRNTWFPPQFAGLTKSRLTHLIVPCLGPHGKGAELCPRTHTWSWGWHRTRRDTVEPERVVGIVPRLHIESRLLALWLHVRDRAECWVVGLCDPIFQSILSHRHPKTDLRQQ